ncbi:lysophospholipid acyltransferase family protein [Methylacidiphilum caldifontis]|uniref:lysophospholipid acyltransferase family protein n=1 Tax=Methylacidiphilum caldifontis TaxID=2795386 RepID=UPI001A904813|nr:lysophospholipid acyltransferase family protein [Methylacidiphilum caldifontis]QSR88305.1 lysophospholipid acyltransferase family protein [Methylacidiphilum caldifontis]
MASISSISSLITETRKWMRGSFSPAVASAFIRSWACTISYDLHDPIGIVDSPPSTPLIFSFWHNRILLMPYLYRKHFPKRKLIALVSSSNDGKFLSRLLGEFNLIPAAGSSSKKGVSAFKTAIQAAKKKGYDIAVTPDGPRGPCYTFQEGVIHLSRLSGFPIIPVSYQLEKKIELRSWDRFQIPFPFTQCTIFVGPLFTVPKNISDHEITLLKKELSKALSR